MDVEWIILADSAEVINNKLYLIGGGWDALTINTDFPVQHPCAIAVAFRVPWNETNQRHDVEIEVVDKDGASLAKVPAQVEVGRPVGTPLGQAQRVQLAIRLTLSLQQPGTYQIITRIEAEETRRVPFHVVLGPRMTGRGAKCRA